MLTHQENKASEEFLAKQSRTGKTLLSAAAVRSTKAGVGPQRILLIHRDKTWSSPIFVKASKYFYLSGSFKIRRVELFISYFSAKEIWICLPLPKPMKTSGFCPSKPYCSKCSRTFCSVLPPWPQALKAEPMSSVTKNCICTYSYRFDTLSWQLSNS